MMGLPNTMTLLALHTLHSGSKFPSHSIRKWIYIVFLFSCFLVFLIATDLVGKDLGDIQDWLQELTDRCYDETGCACYGKFVLRSQNRQGMKLEYLTNKIEKSLQ